MNNVLKSTTKQSLRTVFEGYLERVGHLRIHHLGPDEEQALAPKAVQQEDSQYLERSLNSFESDQNSVFKICVMLLCFLYMLLIGVFIYSFVTRDLFITGAIGSVSAGSWPIISKLHRLWKDSTIIRITENALTNLPPQEAVKVIELIYWGSVRNRGSK